MHRLVKKLLSRYEDHSYTIKLKSRFLFYIYLVIIPAVILGGVITSIANLNNPLLNYSINLKLMSFLLGALMLLLFGLNRLFKGKYEFSAHLILIVITTLIWTIIMTDETYVLSRLDTIVFAITIMSMLPLVITKSPIVIFYYALANIIILVIFIYLFQDSLALPRSSLVSYLGDNSLAIIAVAFIAYNVYSINKKVLEKSKKESQSRKVLAQKLQNHKNNLESFVSEQTEELESRNESLVQKNDIINEQNAELKKTLQNLKDTQEKLIQTEKMASLGILTSGVAHEIINPLNYIQGSLYILQNIQKENSYTENSETINQVLNSLQEGIKRTSDIVSTLNQFNDFSQSYDEECDLHKIIDNCLSILHNKSINRVKVTKKFTEDSSIFIGNRSGIHQVIMNIISNAIDAIEEKGNIRIATAIKQKSIFLEVEDDGVGINAEDLSRITDPFFTTKDPGKGTGLGLSITYKIIENHQGNLSFDSKKGEGTIVKISLPINN